MRKITVAFEQHQEDRLFRLWSQSQSELPYDKWKRKVVKTKAKKENKNSTEDCNITGVDLAHL